MKLFVGTITVHYELRAETEDQASKEVSKFKEDIDALEDTAERAVDHNTERGICSHIMAIDELTDDGSGYLPKDIKDRLVNTWKERVFNQSDAVDKENEHEWETLAYGFFLACGCIPKEATEMVAELNARDLL